MSTGWCVWWIFISVVYFACVVGFVRNARELHKIIDKWREFCDHEYENGIRMAMEVAYTVGANMDPPSSVIGDQIKGLLK